MTKRLLYLLPGLLLAATLAAQDTGADKPAGAQATTRSDDTDCPSDRYQFGDRWEHQQTVQAVEQRTIAPTSITKLSLRPARNGGVEVEGWERNEILVKACKYASGYDTAEAQHRLAGIHLSIQGGEVTADGPDENDWVVHLLVRVPANINLEVSAHNGPISLRGVSGTINAETVNGPISVRRCSGAIHAEARNGPISLSESSGKIHVEAQNGPVTVRLNDKQWKGEGLEASTHNGPLHLTVPTGFQSGVEVVSDGRSPFSCEQCKDENRTWDDRGGKKVRLGPTGAPIVVRMSTINGPVSISPTFD